MQRESLDFKTLPVGKLFSKQFFPALMGMATSSLYVVVDGVFVGHGIGPDGLAAINIATPLYMITAGIGLMFGMGGGVLVSINLSHGKRKVANINITQAVVAMSIISLVLTLLITFFPSQTALLLGSNETLLAGTTEYLFWFAITIPASILLISLPFFVRQTNPNRVMWAMLVGTVVNIILDYIFIFLFKWGLAGAALATDIGELIGALILIVYLFNPKVAVRFGKLKITASSLRLTVRNAWYMMKLGISSCLSEITIAIMIIAGNYTFMRYLGADGVAAYSVICYLFPVIFMVFNAIIQSAQPIISYNYGCGQMERSNRVARLSLIYAVVFSLGIMTLFAFFASGITSLFIPDKSSPALEYAAYGLPLFALDYIFFGVNVIAIGYYTSVERIRRAISLTLLRGVLPIVFFFILPKWFGTPGIWLAVAAGDFLTTAIVAGLLIKDRVYKKQN